MNFHILTLFPEMVEQGLNTSILGRAVEAGHISLEAINIRDYTLDKHKKVDDYPYGGGAGMLMQAQPVFDTYKAVEKKIFDRKCVDDACAIKVDAEVSAKHHQRASQNSPRVIFLTPQGMTFNQEMAEEFAKEEDLIFLCGHYEGIDERVLEEIVTDEVSIGDYVLTGGELASMVMIDAIARLVPGVLNNDESAHTESFHNDLLEYPQYSRPEVWHDKAVPKVLLSGDHKKINKWRLEQSEERTRVKRPDLYDKYQRAQSAIEELMKKKVIHMDMIESLRLGNGKLLCFDERGILINDKKSGVYMLSAKTAESGKAILRGLSEKEKAQMGAVVVHNVSLFTDAADAEANGFTMGQGCFQAVYTRGVTLPVRKDVQIQKLDVTYTDVVYEHYHMIQDKESAIEILDSGVMDGVFVNEQLAGFVGQHEEGSMGMLEIFPEFRGNGLAATLEAFTINRVLGEGRIPYCQIFDDNEASLRLQEKLGLRISKEKLWWMMKK